MTDRDIMPALPGAIKADVLLHFVMYSVSN